MIPLNALAKDPFRTTHPLVKHRRFRMPIVHPVQMQHSNEVCIKKAKITLLTTPDLRSVHIFHFKDNETKWHLFEPGNSTLSRDEVKGSMTLAIKKVRQRNKELVNEMTTNTFNFITDKEEITSALNEFNSQDKIFIVATFKEYVFADGNFFDETTICRALLNYRPRRLQNVISTVKECVDLHRILSKRPFLVKEKR